tara:strand:+ start:161 stop:553 length:393 start_codon:yes stop_codon:yes gene_type:complete
MNWKIIMKTAKDFLNEANENVPKIDVNEGIEKHSQSNVVFVDVRDSQDINKTGTIAGALRIPRGMIEFFADETHPLHNENMKKNSQIILVCGAGGQAALAGNTLLQMGYEKVVNIGGFKDWKNAGGPSES